MNGLPVIVSAHTGLSGDGHSFIIDGFKSYKTKYTYTYEWVYDSSPYIEQVKMNWGWANQLHNNEAWYTPVENWSVTSDQHGGQMTFSHNKKMIYDFMN